MLYSKKLEVQNNISEAIKLIRDSAEQLEKEMNMSEYQIIKLICDLHGNLSDIMEVK